MESLSTTKRLAKNTFSMYVRMLFLMFIGFYTSRVVLRALGAEDFGTYNVVGGVVVMFTFINAAMTTGTQRHLSFELGKPDGDISRLFSACLNIHLWLAILVFILAETIGLWFVNTQLNLPEGRMAAVNWVYQFSIISCLFNIVRVPYNALIIANERMSYYAYIGIVEGILKLLIAFLLALSPIDRLVFYALLVTVVVLIVTICYYSFCRTQFREVQYVGVKEKSLYNNLLNFSGWTLFGSLANLGRNQGVSFIINIFYGVTLNAAVGLANQVNAAISQFVSGFQQAFNPHLTKTEASQDRAYQQQIICSTSKISYLIIFFVAIPVLYNLKYLLGLWLGDYPEYTGELCLWIVIASMIDAISGPLWVSILATGKIKAYQIVISTLLLLSLPLACICGRSGWQPQYVFAFQAGLNVLAIIVRLLTLNKLIHFDVLQFAKTVILPITLVTISIIPLCVLCLRYLSTANNFGQFIIHSGIIAIYEIVVIALLGLTRSERLGVRHLLAKN